MACWTFFMSILDGHKKFFRNHLKGCSLVAFTLAYFAFLALGSCLFHFIEGPQELINRQKVLNIKSAVMAKFPDMPEGAIEHIYSELSSAGVKGIISENDTVNWTFGNSFLFAMTLVTTIGYGHLSPSTEIGKIAVLIYATFGIPLTLFIVAMHVEMLTSLSNSYKANLFRRLGFKHPFFVRTLHFLSISIFFVVGIFLIPGWIFFSQEIDWSYFDSIYFIFISVTTVGLGDFVPGLAANHQHIELYRYISAIYISVAMAVAMFMMTLLTDYLNNCTKGFRIIPVKIVPEKEPIMPENPPSYGAIVIPEVSDETRLLLS